MSSLLDQLDQIQTEALAALENVGNETALEAVRLEFLSKKGRLSAASAGLRDVPKDQKPAVGQRLNEVRQAIDGALDDKRQHFLDARDAASVAGIDVTLPGRSHATGAIHPVSQVQDRAIQILRRLGFALATGPEVETEWHCFDALNTPEDHPARNESDTFYLPAGTILRTHTSSVQIRTMETSPPPVRIIAPGSAYRRDEIDATHLSAFHQLEGLYVDRDVTLPDLKGTLEYLLKCLFGDKTEVRFRPHFFPFTEPSFEIDVWLDAAGKWIELAGCGMVDPAVFESICQARGDRLYDPDKVTGFAFGMGIERLAMNLFGVSDIRHFIDNDQRFLRQFA